MPNFTRITGFKLTGLSDIQELQTVCGVFFLVMYLGVLTSNFLIISLITLDLKLHRPMYFFLKNLSLLDVFLVSVPIPNFFVNSLTHNNFITLLGCAFQILFMTSFSAGEIFVLTAMSYDRYVAICCPLHYEIIMSSGTCMAMVAVSWATGLLFGIVYTADTFSTSFCGSNVIPQFFCDIPSLLKMSCSEILGVIFTSLGIGMCLCMACFICVVISYCYIFSTVLKIPSNKGQSKALATCIPHLTVFTVFIATACFVYLRPPLSNTPSATDRLFSVLYTVLPPALNPLIYSLRNTDIKCALKRLQQNHCPWGSLHVTLQSICQWYSPSWVANKFCNF